MTFKQAEKYKDENIARVRAHEKDGLSGKPIRYEGLVIATNTSETRKNEIITKCLDGEKNKSVLEEYNLIDEDLNVFYVFKLGGENVVMPLASYLSILDSAKEQGNQL